jgi:ABC-type branched-subunit amino acid transport system substrate-binding protein
VKIGVILPLSGNNANIGEWQRDALKLFEKELSQRKTKHQYQFIVEDDQMVGRLTAEACNKLINLDHVAAILSNTSGSGNVVTPRAEQAKILHIGMASDTKVAKGNYNYIHWTPPSAEVSLFIKLVEAKKYKRIAILGVRQQGILTIISEIKKQLPTGVELVDETNFNPGERDFRIILARIAEKKPDLLLIEAFSPELQIILRQRKQAGLDCDVSSIEAFRFLSEKDEEIKTLQGTYHISTGSGTEEFVKKLNSIGIKEANFGMPFTYDSLGLIVDALEQCSNPNADRTPALAYMNAIKDRPSAVGSITVDAQHVFHSPAGLYKIEGTKSVPASLDELKK